MATEHIVEDLRGPDAEGAVRSLYRHYGAELYGFARRRLGDRQLAEELVQDVFTRAWRHAGEFDPRRATVRTWLFAIARNALVDAERRRAARPRLAVHEEREPGGEEADEPIERALLRWQVESALVRLTPEHREVIRLAYFGGMTLREVAERTGLPLGTVKSRASYALRNLRLILDEAGVSS